MVGSDWGGLMSWGVVCQVDNGGTAAASCRDSRWRVRSKDDSSVVPNVEDVWLGCSRGYQSL